MTPSTLATAMGIPLGRAQLWAQPLTYAMTKFDISTPARVAAFIAQIGHESAGLDHLEEDFNYSAARLCEMWPHHFYLPPDTPVLIDQNSGKIIAADRAFAMHYAYRPIAIGNHVYRNRMGNGPESTGDGYNFKGRGPIQLTGHDNYAACGAGIGQNLVSNPNLVLQPDVGALTAAWFWHSRHGNEFADRGDFESLTLAIAGGTTGLEDRAERLRIATNALLPFGPGDPSTTVA